MSPMKQLDAVIQNEHGIHVRPSTQIIEEVADYTGDVHLSSSKGESDLRSVLSLLLLGLQKGDQITLGVTGPDEEEFCERLVTLFETKFDFPPEPKK